MPPSARLMLDEDSDHQVSPTFFKSQLQRCLDAPTKPNASRLRKSGLLGRNADRRLKTLPKQSAIPEDDDDELITFCLKRERWDRRRQRQRFQVERERNYDYKVVLNESTGRGSVVHHEPTQPEVLLAKSSRKALITLRSKGKTLRLLKKQDAELVAGSRSHVARKTTSHHASDSDLFRSPTKTKAGKMRPSSSSRPSAADRSKALSPLPEWTWSGPSFDSPEKCSRDSSGSMNLKQLCMSPGFLSPSSSSQRTQRTASMGSSSMHGSSSNSLLLQSPSLHEHIEATKTPPGSLHRRSSTIKKVAVRLESAVEDQDGLRLIQQIHNTLLADTERDRSSRHARSSLRHQQDQKLNTKNALESLHAEFRGKAPDKQQSSSKPVPILKQPKHATPRVARKSHSSHLRSAPDLFFTTGAEPVEKEAVVSSPTEKKKKKKAPTRKSSSQDEEKQPKKLGAALKSLGGSNSSSRPLDLTIRSSCSMDKSEHSTVAVCSVTAKTAAGKT